MRNFRPHRFAIAPVQIVFAVIVALFVMVNFPGSLNAQTNISGDIAGTVTDSSGAAIPGATVTITSVDTGAVQTVTTASAGEYRAALLKPGNFG